MTVPVLVYATARGTVMGAHDVFVQHSVNGHGTAGAVAVFDSAMRLFWLVFLCLSVLVLCAMLLRSLIFR